MDNEPGTVSTCSLLITTGATAVCFLCALFAFRSNIGGALLKFKKKKTTEELCGCFCSRGGRVGDRELEGADGMVVYGRESSAVVVERQAGGSMMEQLVPEIRTHALSYLDYRSLCRLSMTNSSMRRAANDDAPWKELYRKDFTVEQDTVTPQNGWKSYYAVTKAIVNVNAEFYDIIRARSLPGMSRFWLNADYVKCVHASGEMYAGYNAVIQSWGQAFDWDHGADFQIHDVRARILSEMAWITMNAYVDVDSGPFHVTNLFEFHNGRWCMVHHHSSVILHDEDPGQHNVFG